jgi:hypothetical protein
MRTLEVDWTVRRAGDAVLVGVELRNRTGTPRRVRVENLVDGELLPPRRAGVPESGWDAAGFSGTVDAEGRLVIGYACRGEPARPPVDVTDEGRADGDAAVDSGETDLVDRAIRELGSARPPSSVVPAVDLPGEAEPDDATAEIAAADDAVGACDADAVVETGDADAVAATGDAEDIAETGDADEIAATGGTGETDQRAGPTAPPGRDASDALPSTAAVDAWLDAVAARVELAERFTDASVVEATEALADAGGLAETAALARRVDGDAARLRAVADRATRLAARADATDVPVEALRRLS